MNFIFVNFVLEHLEITTQLFIVYNNLTLALRFLYFDRPSLLLRAWGGKLRLCLLFNLLLLGVAGLLLGGGDKV